MLFLVGILSVVVAGVGFIVLHVALTQKTAELRVGGWVLVWGAILNIAGMVYFVPESSLYTLGQQQASHPIYVTPYQGYYDPMGGMPPRECEMEKQKKSKKMHLDAPPAPADAGEAK